MRHAEPRSIYLKDYEVPRYLIDDVDLDFDLYDRETRVKATLQVRRNPDSRHKGAELVLHGEQLRTHSIAIDGRVLTADEYRIDADGLHIPDVPERFALTTEVLIDPIDNASLEGLYRSRTLFCTQCEAEGFRKITWYLDRPDVLARFTTTVRAERAGFPVLLSNGNLVANGVDGDGRHWATWEDPFPKPSYLFALVAGDLAHVRDSYVTASGRTVELLIYVETKDLDKCDHAMQALKDAMRWDEDNYGLEYDLDRYMIVAVDDFNMGAMENKGLNIFNTSCVLANPATTTDAGFERVASVVAHEYFHNWSGNRVTCRDWFQLSLKEGFTVFRDSEFSADHGSRALKRIEDVTFLRTQQFAEDGGPMAHPVRPDAYMEISNFYTLTIYEKGAEVVRMIHHLLGPELFRRGSDLYFERFDGQAVTIEDFVGCMAEVSGRDFTRFMNWYRQAGTPQLAATGHYDAAERTFTLTVQQSCAPTREAQEKQPFHIPVSLGLVGRDGDLPLYGPVVPDDRQGATQYTAEITESSQSLVFTGVDEEPVPSLLRGFSAPVKLEYPYSREQLRFLMTRDSDSFNRWDAGQKLALSVLGDMMAAYRAGEPLAVDDGFVAALRQIAGDETLEPALVAQMLTLPSEAFLAEAAEVIDVEAIHHARQTLRVAVADALRDELLSLYEKLDDREPYQPSAQQIGRRSLKNTALTYLTLCSDQPALALAEAQYGRHANMTDVSAALAALVNAPADAARPLAEAALADFYQRWQHDALVVNQWLTLQAASPLPGGLERVEQLMQHEAFSLRNPNKVRAVIGAFCANAINFHRDDGAGYRFLTEQVIAINAFNPQIAARLLVPLTRWREYPEQRSQQLRAELQQLAARSDLAKDLYEVVNKSL